VFALLEGEGAVKVNSPKRITALLDTVSIAWICVLGWLVGWRMPTETGCSCLSATVESLEVESANVAVKCC
jgi:hypothetical protein